MFLFSLAFDAKDRLNVQANSDSESVADGQIFAKGSGTKSAVAAVSFIRQLIKHIYSSILQECRSQCSRGVRLAPQAGMRQWVVQEAQWAGPMGLQQLKAA